MKYIKSAFLLITALLCSTNAFAAQTVPEDPVKKILWAVENSGPMPRPMLVGLILLVAMIVITILVALMKGDEGK